MACVFKPDFEIIEGVPYSLFSGSLAQNTECPSTYLRPDPGGALIPWLYTLFLLFFHLPAVVLRAVKWQSAQYLSLALALLSVGLCIQSYVSTRLAPQEVLVWMPLTLALDVGAMLQMVVLIIEKHHGTRVLLDALITWYRGLWEPRTNKPGAKVVRDQTANVPLQRMGSATAASPPAAAQQSSPHVSSPSRPATARRTSLVSVSTLMSKNAWDENKRRDDELPDALACMAAFILMLVLITLQIYGIYASATGMNRANHSSLTVRWCSPAFRDFALAISTGNCEVFPVSASSSNGIGCINLPARQQRDWLVSTLAVLAASLVIQLVDMALMKCARGRQCRGVVDMQRPWFTMIAGILTLVILLVFGIFHAARLPPGVTDVVWIYRKEEMSAVGRACHGTLKAPGLRGMIIGWTDGLFDGWGPVYHGNVVSRAVAWVRRDTALCDSAL